MKKKEDIEDSWNKGVWFSANNPLHENSKQVERPPPGWIVSSLT